MFRGGTMDSIAATVGWAYLVIGIVVGVYAAARHFREDAEDWNMLAMFAVVLAIIWPGVLYMLIKRRMFPDPAPVKDEAVTRTKTLV